MSRVYHTDAGGQAMKTAIPSNWGWPRGRSGPEHGTLLRLASTHAAESAAEVMDRIWKIAGASSIYVGGPFERRYRDIHTATQNFAIRAEHYATAGKMLLDQSDGH